MHYAAECQNLEIAELLHNFGFEICSQASADKSTPLHIAMTKPNKELIEQFIKWGGAYAIRDGNNHYYMDRAILCGNIIGIETVFCK